jgi:acetone carboxylase gamma subunit
VNKAVELIGAPVAIDDLVRASVAYEERVTEVVASDEDVQAYVRSLEERADEVDEDDAIELPSGEALAAELEKFLRERTEGDDPGVGG